MSNSSVRSILDFSDDILVEIILYLNAIERLALGNSCQRFNDLVFGDEVLLRNLDFTRGYQCPRISDVQQYFDNQNTYEKIHSLHGLRFESVAELSSFLKPLVHLKRLSVNWPGSDTERDYDYSKWNQVLGEPFGRLTHLSLQLNVYTRKFLLVLLLCQQLEELRMDIRRQGCHDGLLHQEPMKLNSLKSVSFTENGPFLGELRNDFMSIVPDPAEWTDFYLHTGLERAHLERNVEVCAELQQLKTTPPPEFLADFRGTGLIDTTWPLVSEHLLSEVIRVTHQDAPKKFCCFTRSLYSLDQSCTLEIDEAKKLLKDPAYQISYLYVPHEIEKNCDVHLVASAFPNLTELDLYKISNRNSRSRPKRNKPLHRCLTKKGSLAFEEHGDAKNMESSFKMLVENTPRLKVLTISPSIGDSDPSEEDWDLDAFGMISGWKNLTVLRLDYLPITDGKFLIDIGRECKQLEEVKLFEIGYYSKCNYDSELLQMLQHCKNLRKFSNSRMSSTNVPEMLSLLSNSLKLEFLDFAAPVRDCDWSFVDHDAPCDSLELVSSVEKMLRQCRWLNHFDMRIFFNAHDELRLAIESIVSEFNRPDLWFSIS